MSITPKARLVAARILILLSLVIFGPTSLYGEGRKKSPENPSIILLIGGGAVLVWRYVRSRLGR